SLNDDVDLVRVDPGSGGISRYCATSGLLADPSLAGFCRNVSRANNPWLDHLVDCETTTATATASVAAGPHTRSARADAGADRSAESVSIQHPCVGHSSSLRNRTTWVAGDEPDIGGNFYSGEISASVLARC